MSRTPFLVPALFGGLVAVAALTPRPLLAQLATTPAMTASTPSAVERLRVGPVAAPVAVHAPTAQTALVVTTDAHMGAGQNVALMGVGGAALIVGLIVGGGAGTAIAVGGGIVGLYGLYRYLQ